MSTYQTQNKTMKVYYTYNFSRKFQIRNIKDQNLLVSKKDYAIIKASQMDLTLHASSETQKSQHF